jgi:hypothetical protein
MPTVLACLIIAVAKTATGQPPPITGVKEVDTEDRVAAPVYYKDQMLVLATDQGVAAVVFTDKVKEGAKEGRKYKFRYESKDGKTKESGTGAVYENYKRVPQKEAGKFAVEDLGSELYLKAGPIKLEWSLAEDESGWLYYNPDKVRVQIASADEFDKVSLKRFAK